MQRANARLGVAELRRIVMAWVTAILMVASVAGAQPANGLFLDAGAPDLPLVASRAPIRERFVRPRFDLFDRSGTTDLAARQDTRLTVNLFADLTVTAVLDAIDIQQSGMVWSGHVEGRPGSRVTWSIVGDALAGEVRLGGALYEVRSGGGGVHVIREVDQAAFPPELEPLVPPIPNPDARAPSDPQPAAPQSSGDDGSVVDVLVVWTPAAQSAAGGDTAIRALIDLAVFNANAARANSGVTHTMNLVHKEEVAYIESGSLSTDLNRLTFTDGFIDNVHTLRNTHGADLVALIVSNPGCGIAWVMDQNSTAFAPFGFSVNRWDCIAGNLTLAHEWGHNQGLAHEMTNGLFSYSHGHNNEICRTVMGTAAGVRQQSFSNPATNFPAEPCTADPSGVLTISENARTLNETVAAVANFRQSVTCSFSISPTNVAVVSAGASGSVAVTAGSGCSWIAVSNDAWITVTSGAAGTGNGTVSYSVAANTTSSQRTGTITIGGQTFTVTQASTTFTDDPLTAGTPIKATHILEIRARIDALRDACLPALSAFPFTDSTLTAGSTTAKAVHVTDPRTALSEAYVNCAQTAPTFATVVAIGVVITTAPIKELRMLVEALEAITSSSVVQHMLQVSRFTTSTLTDADADQILSDGTSVLQTNDGAGDVACGVELSRSGGVTTFATGDGSIDSSAEFNAVNGLPGNVKVVNQINWCGTLLPNVIGCAPPGTSFVVVRFTTSLEGILWDHEYGHNKGLDHRTDGNAVMNGSIASTRRRVTQSECDAFLQ